MASVDDNLRLLIHGSAPAAWNMAVDEALLRRGRGFALRFYRWRPAAISVGYHQRWGHSHDVDRAAGLGLSVVRRPTGGRAVLHDDELTYCLTGPSDHPRLEGGVLAAYRALATGLAAGLRRLGVPVEVERSGGREGSGVRQEQSIDAACFAVRSRYELVARGRKLLGSAQRRRHGRLLQHGSLLLGPPDPGRWAALGPGAGAARGASIGLEELLGRRPGLRRLAGTLARGLADSLGLEVRVGGLTCRERREVGRWLGQYGSVRWTRGGRRTGTREPPTPASDGGDRPDPP